MENRHLQKSITRVFSLVFPGMGLIFYRKWLSGIVFAAIHLVISGVLLKKMMYDIAYYVDVPDGHIEGNTEKYIIILAVIFINWGLNILFTEKTEPIAD